jgi:hypothetical protein
MIVDSSAIYEMSFPIDTNCEVTCVSCESELALPACRFDDQLVDLWDCGYSLLFWLHFCGLMLTACREREEGRDNEKSSRGMLHGKRSFLN